MDFACSTSSSRNGAITPSINPSELVWGILLSLSKLKNAQSFLLPILLERSKTFLSLENPNTNPTFDIPDNETLLEEFYGQDFEMEIGYVQELG